MTLELDLQARLSLERATEACGVRTNAVSWKPLRPGFGSAERSFDLPSDGEFFAVTRGIPLSRAAVVAGVLAAVLSRIFGATNLLLACPGQKAAAGSNPVTFLSLSPQGSAPLGDALRRAAKELETALSAPGLDPVTIEREIDSRFDLHHILDIALEGEGLGELPPLKDKAALHIRLLPGGQVVFREYGAIGEGLLELIIAQCEHACAEIKSRAPQLLSAMPLVPDTMSSFAAEVSRPALPPFDFLGEIEKAVKKTPDAPAVRCGNAVLTFEELDRLANNVTAELTNRGIGRNDVVGVFLPREPRFIAAVLGILRAGAAFLPLEPSMPATRLSFVCEDAGVRALVSSLQVSLQLEIAPSPLLNLDALATPETPPLVVARQPQDLCYVLYTSGSSGEPKGVMVEDRAMERLTAWICTNFYNDPSTDRALLTAAFSFDASLQQMLAPICCGCELVIASDRERRDPNRYADLLLRSRATVIDITPAFLARALDVLARRDSAPDLKTILVGGDALTRGLAFKALDQLPHLALINVYGTTETGCDSTFYKITRDEIDEAIPVGEPLPGVGITIRDTNGDVLPRGVAGEVCIEGDAVGRGYIRHSDKNRFSSVDGTRRFMSRDQGLLDAEGRLHILGRMDNEVKINGYRVDLNGVANAISRFRSGGFEIRPSDLTADESARQCESCGLTETHPGVTFENQICSVCDGYAKSQEVYDRYFGEGLDGLKNALGAPGALGTAYDCMLLYSGGKDSSYVLYRLIEMGYKVLAFTFDNGHISKAAFKNIARQTKRLGVDSHVEGLQQMDAVFLESLFEESTVCSGCFKALTATSTRLAADLGIPAVLTGLSRGQIAETKLERLINGGVSDIDELERQLVMMRTLYHSAADSANALIDINLEDVDLSAIAFLDYFRYDPVQTRQVREYLSERDDYWAQPKDTGFCSSNCMINDSGVCVHLRNRRFHNYASPLAWDLRLAVVDPDEMQAELRSDIPVKGVNKLLRKLGYFEAIIKDVVVDVVDAPNGGKALCAYYVAESEISFEAMRNHLTRLLPSYMIPLFFVPCKSIPLTTSGKPDRSAFPSLSQAIGMSVEYAAAETAAEQALVGIWQEVLHLDKIGIDDPFFSLGGKSLDLFEVQKLLEERHGWDFDIVDMFELETIRKIASNLKVNPQTAPKEVVFEV